MSELDGPKFKGFDGDHEVIYAKVEREHLRELPQRSDLSAEDLEAAANVAKPLAKRPALPEGQAIEVAKLVAPPASASTPGEEPRAEAPTPRIQPQPSTQPQAEVQPAPESQPTLPAPHTQPPLVQLAPEPQPAPQPRPTLPALQPQPPLAQSAAASSSQEEAEQQEQQLQQLQRQESEVVVQKQELLEARQAVYKAAAEQAERDARASTPGEQEPGDEHAREEPGGPDWGSQESSAGQAGMETTTCESDVPEEESHRPAAALPSISEEDRPDPSRFRRQGLPMRVFVDRLGDFYQHVSGRDLMVEKLAEILRERRLAVARASTPGEVVRKNNWVILARPLQEVVMDNIFKHWGTG